MLSLFTMKNLKCLFFQFWFCFFVCSWVLANQQDKIDELNKDINSDVITALQLGYYFIFLIAAIYTARAFYSFFILDDNKSALKMIFTVVALLVLIGGAIAIF